MQCESALLRSHDCSSILRIPLNIATLYHSSLPVIPAESSPATPIRDRQDIDATGIKTSTQFLDMIDSGQNAGLVSINKSPSTHELNSLFDSL